MTTNATKSVRFESSAPIVYEAPLRKGKRALWLRKEEYREMYLQEKYLIEQVRIGVFVEGDEDSFRGLEARTKQGKRRLAGVQEVLLEQNKQTSLGRRNDQAVAKIYAQCTRVAAKLAYNMARKDARTAAAIHRETDQLFQRTSRRPPFGLLKKAISFREALTPPRVFRRYDSGRHDTKRRLSLEGLLSFREISLTASPEAMTTQGTQAHLLNQDTPSSIPASSATSVLLQSNRGEQQDIVKAINNIPSRIPFVGEPSQLSSSPKKSFYYRSYDKTHSTTARETAHYRSDRLRKRPSLDVLLKSNNANTKIEDDDRTAPTVSSTESTSGFLIKPMHTRVRL